MRKHLPGCFKLNTHMSMVICEIKFISLFFDVFCHGFRGGVGGGGGGGAPGESFGMGLAGAWGLCGFGLSLLLIFSLLIA